MSHLERQLEALGQRVRVEQDALIDGDHSLGAVRTRVLSSARPARALLLRRGLLLAAALGIGLIGLVAPRLLRRAPLVVTADSDHHTVGAGDWIRVGNAPIPLDFSDGTSITLDPGSRARLEAVDAAGAQLTIEAGHADVKVVPGRDGRWHLSLGPFGVDVTGTQFDIGWNPDAEELSLTMREGKVLVSGCVLGDRRPLLAGEHLTASCRDRRFEVSRERPVVADNSAPASDTARPASLEAAPSGGLRSDG
ncbi:MAG TPA: FecR domain-containing protein, partial [Polyangiaceae bacterium]|nr:FecR domain-containing protein [Polyangiaceae bacterium]